MKKLIVLSVVFALVASAAFAVDLGGTVIGTVDLVKSDTSDDAKNLGAGTLNRVRIDGGGEAGEGKFGGYFRYNDGGFSGNAWWKPIDQVKLLIGSNGGDGFYGKEGVAGWMFYQTVSDTGVTMGGDNVWGGGGLYGQGLKYRNAFYGGDGGGDALRLEITPIDILGINLSIPYFMADPDNDLTAEVADIFKEIVAQVDLHFDFGNIALTYVGKGNYIQNGNNNWAGADGSVIFAYFGGSFGDLALDVGLGYQLADDNDQSSPLAIGLGLKYATDAFGIKFRLAASMAGQGNNKDTMILTDILPYFSLGDNLTAFISVGLGMRMPDGGGDTVIGWHFSPYLQVGEEWGAKFLVGIKVKSDGGDDAIISWGIPIALSVGF